MCATRSCTTAMSSKASRQRARASSRSSPRCRPAQSRFSARTGCRGRSRTSRRRAAFRCSTPPARSSPRFTTRASAMSSRDARVILIGHAGHPEVEGTMGQIDGPVLPRAERGGRVSARPFRPTRRSPTSPRPRFSVDDTRAIDRGAASGGSPTSSGPDTRDICYATQNRQTAVRELAQSGRPHSRRRRDQQLEFQSPARDRRGGGRAELSRRRRQRGRPRWVRRQVGRWASPRGRRRPKCWSMMSSTRSRAFGPVESRRSPASRRSVEFRLPRELVELSIATRSHSATGHQGALMGIPLQSGRCDRQLYRPPASVRAGSAIRSC